MTGDSNKDKIETSIHQYWVRKVATEELTCWGSNAKINIGDSYYEYNVEIKLYGNDIEFPRPVVTEREYFKGILQGRPGFKYIEERE